MFFRKYGVRTTEKAVIRREQILEKTSRRKQQKEKLRNKSQTEGAIPCTLDAKKKLSNEFQTDTIRVVEMRRIIQSTKRTVV